MSGRTPASRTAQAFSTPPEAVTRALPSLLETGLPTGGYSNTFAPIDPGRTGIGHRHDLDSEFYRDHVARWVIVDGYCGTMPQYIVLLRSMIDDTVPAGQEDPPAKNPRVQVDASGLGSPGRNERTMRSLNIRIPRERCVTVQVDKGREVERDYPLLRLAATP